MSNVKFKVGDRVCALSICGRPAGKTGTVRGVDNGLISVVFDENFGGHTLRGDVDAGLECSKGYGWLCHEDGLILADATLQGRDYVITK